MSTLINLISGRYVAFLCFDQVNSQLSVKVSIVINKDLKSKVDKRLFLDDEPLSEADPLSDIFPQEPAPRTLHIVIQAPPAGEYIPAFCCVPITFHSVPHPGPLLPTLDLYCLLDGDDASHIFSVEISNNKSVSTLKEFIKDKKKLALQHADADALKLWKVSILVDASFKENVGKVELRDEEALSPVCNLSHVFTHPEPAPRTLHIVIRAPLIGEC